MTVAEACERAMRENAGFEGERFDVRPVYMTNGGRYPSVWDKVEERGLRKAEWIARGEEEL